MAAKRRRQRKANLEGFRKRPLLLDWDTGTARRWPSRCGRVCVTQVARNRFYVQQQRTTPSGSSFWDIVETRRTKATAFDLAQDVVQLFNQQPAA